LTVTNISIKKILTQNVGEEDIYWGWKNRIKKAIRKIYGSIYDILYNSKEIIKMIADTEKIRATIIVHGNVQRSDYRARVISTAKMMNITGTVQNLSDGNVKIIAEGEKINIDRFCDEIDVKNFLIKVTKIERKEDSKPIGEYESFYKLVGEGETDERLDTAAELLKELIVVTKSGFGKVEKELEILEAVTKDGFDRIEKR
jgi:acylphosphatase